jgi:hypothetical protein
MTIADTDRQWIAEHFASKALLHRIDPYTGLTESDFLTDPTMAHAAIQTLTPAHSHAADRPLRSVTGGRISRRSVAPI